MKTKIEIKSVFGSVLFSFEKENNTIKDTLQEAVRQAANLGGADLRDANLRGADLGDAKSIPYIPLNCPSEGAFTGWKKVGDYLIELEIPADARRLSSISYKCRCDKALVKSITLLNDSSCQIEAVVNNSYKECHYKVGELVVPDSFDEDRWNECSHGIHFFINKQDAINY